jgi:primosomal protein N'
MVRSKCPNCSSTEIKKMVVGGENVKNAINSGELL